MHKIGKHGQDNHEDPGAWGIRKLIAIGESTRDASLNLLSISKELESMIRRKGKPQTPWQFHL